MVGYISASFYIFTTKSIPHTHIHTRALNFDLDVRPCTHGRLMHLQPSVPGGALALDNAHHLLRKPLCKLHPIPLAIGTGQHPVHRRPPSLPLVQRYRHLLRKSSGRLHRLEPHERRNRVNRRLQIGQRVPGQTLERRAAGNQVELCLALWRALGAQNIEHLLQVLLRDRFLAVLHQQVDDLAQQRRVPVVQVRGRRQGKRRQREFGNGVGRVQLVRGGGRVERLGVLVFLRQGRGREACGVGGSGGRGGECRDILRLCRRRLCRRRSSSSSSTRRRVIVSLLIFYVCWPVVCEALFLTDDLAGHVLSANVNVCVCVCVCVCVYATKIPHPTAPPT